MESPFTGLDARTKAKVRARSSRRRIAKEGRSTYGTGGSLPIGEANQLLLIRNVILDKDGCLCKITRSLASALKYPHHVGAGGEETES
jgi:hypothetical protein